MANRKTRRKQSKNKKIEEIEIKSTSTDILNKVIISLTIICILGLFYLLTVYITNKHTEKDSSEEKETTETAIDYEKILVGNSFSMSDTEYLVVYYDTSDADVSKVYRDLVSNYKAKEEHLPIYYVDMNNSLNKKYATTEESNKNPTKASELLINGPTLIRVANNALVEYVEGEEAITNYLS